MASQIRHDLSLLVFFLITGLLLLLYPTVSDYWNSHYQLEAVATYSEKLLDISKEEKQKILENVSAYNSTLEKGTIPNLNIDSVALKKYESILNITDTGIMGYVEIPKLQTTLPIYHGTDDAVLQVAVGHLAGTSLPIGGQGSHAAISGHRGLPSAKLFSDLDQLVIGDTFMIQVLDNTLTYEIDKIITVTPDDVSPLMIDPNEDFVTLVTCTPYGVNSHRLLVRGHRIENQLLTKQVVSEGSIVKPILVSPFIALCLLGLLWSLFFIKKEVNLFM
ncbi:class C sortase [Streptococcus suis]|nr:class C sortase [Streptococcus suis]HEM2823750.1 class C sortase [Streptococcus suis]HEM2834550.1 class C sortase [Streptococcus suis]HEM2843114.1 class C sortase [Streptococcus suis]HEM2847335.1 class C sortase [Streptococcus suis]